MPCHIAISADYLDLFQDQHAILADLLGTEGRILELCDELGDAQASYDAALRLLMEAETAFEQADTLCAPRRPFETQALAVTDCLLPTTVTRSQRLYSRSSRSTCRSSLLSCGRKVCRRTIVAARAESNPGALSAALVLLGLNAQDGLGKRLSGSPQSYASTSATLVSSKQQKRPSPPALTYAMRSSFKSEDLSHDARQILRRALDNFKADLTMSSLTESSVFATQRRTPSLC